MPTLTTFLYSYWYSTNGYNADAYGRFTYFKQQLKLLPNESPLEYIRRIRRIQRVWKNEELRWLCQRIFEETLTDLFHNYPIGVANFHIDLIMLKQIGDCAKENNLDLYKSYETMYKLFEDWCYGRRNIPGNIREDFETFPYMR